MGIDQIDQYWMQCALELAQQAQEQGEVPVGAILVRENQLIAQGHNRSIGAIDTTAHAEIQAIRAANKILNNYRLPNTTLYTTLEPCPMCAGAIIHARIKRLVFGAFDPKTGAAGSVFNILQNKQLNHQLEVTPSILESVCSQQLKAFFQKKRALSAASSLMNI